MLRIRLVYLQCRFECDSSFCNLDCNAFRREVKHLLPATVLKLKSVRPQVWTTTVHEKLYSSVETMTINEAKTKLLGIDLFLWIFFEIYKIQFRYYSNMASIWHDVFCCSSWLSCSFDLFFFFILICVVVCG